MTDLVGSLDALADQFTTVQARLVVTLVAVGVVATLTWLTHQIRSRVETRTRGAIADLMLSLVVAMVTVTGAAVVLGTWGLAGIVYQGVINAGIGRDFLIKLILTVVLIVATFIVVGFIKRFLDDIVSTHDSVSDHQREVTYRLTQISLYLIAGIIALGFWEFDLSGFLIGAGFLGVIIGFAARHTIAAVVAGFVLMFSRPFKVGDWIVVGDHEGIVTDITAVNTRIQTFDGEYVIVPNDEVTAQSVTNRSKKGRLRLRVEVSVDYETDLDRASTVIRDAIRDIDQILSVPTPQIIVTDFGEYAIHMEVRFWIDRPSARRRWRSRQVVIRRIKTAFEEEGVKIPFPQRELSGRAGSERFHLQVDGDDRETEQNRRTAIDGDDS